MSSFWSRSLYWQVLFCSVTSAFTTDLLTSAFTKFAYTGNFGQLKMEKYILFQTQFQFDLNILGVIPSIILGIFGGLLGSLFIFTNLKLAALRSSIQGRIIGGWGWGRELRNMAKMSEPLLVMLISSTVYIMVPLAFPCKPLASMTLAKVM